MPERAPDLSEPATGPRRGLRSDVTAAAAGLLWIGLCGLSHPAHGERRADATIVRTDATQAAADAPSEAVAIAAFLRAREWLDADSLPAPASPESGIPLAGVEGVCVLLRLDGRLVGAGQDADRDDRMLRRAVGRAVADALADSTIAAVREAAGDRVTVRLSLEIELAGPLRPLLGRTILEAAERVTPGIDGLALRRGERVERAFPSRLLASDLAARPDANLVSLLRAAGLPPRDLDEFEASERVSLARFATIRLREPRPGEAPGVVTRAGRTLDLSEVTRESTQALANRLVAKLAAQVVERDRSDASAGAALLGPYNPTADAHDPPLAGIASTAHAAVALAEASHATFLPEALRATAAAKARALAAAVLAAARAPTDVAEAGKDETSERAPARLGPQWIAMAIRAQRRAAGEAASATETAADSDFRALLAEVSARPNGGATGATDGEAVIEPLRPEAVAWIAAACAAGAEPDDGIRAAAIIDSLLARSEARPAMLEVLAPLSLAARAPGFPAERRSGVQRVARETLDELRSFQMGESPESTRGLPPDLEGVLLLPGALRLRSDLSFTLPVASGVVLGVALDAGPAVEGQAERSRSIRRFVRALMQFTAEEPWIDGFRNPEALRGLVRTSLQADDAEPGLLAHGLLLALAALDSAAFPGPE